MISVAFHNGKQDTRSAPFYVYNGSDTIYAGDASGYLHEFTGVFLGTPAEVTTGGWPIEVNTSSYILTSPVYDSVSGNIFVADSGGYLYSYGASSATLVGKSSPLANGPGIVDAPLVDSTTGMVYAFVGEDYNTGTNDWLCDNSNGCDGVFQFSTTFSGAGSSSTCVWTHGSSGGAGSWPSGTQCGREAVFGSGGTSGTSIYAGSFDQAYYDNPGLNGNLWVCATNPTPAARLNYVSFASGTNFAGTPLAFASGSAINPLTSSSSSCSPVTEFLDISATTTLSAAITSTGATSISVSSGTKLANSDYIQVDSEVMQISSGGGTTSLTVTRGVLGTSAATHSQGATVNDIHDWIYLGVTGTGNQSACASAGCVYNFNVISGVPSSATAGIAAASGSSGIIIDNASLSAGASQIYFSSLANESCQSTTSGCAVQASQSAP
jgi:hypothetical protein